MGYFKKIKLFNYRNFTYFENDFSERCNVLFGENGSGKTNILEAISLFGKGRGFRKDNISNIIKFKEESFINYGYFYNQEIINEIKVSSEKNQKNFKKKMSLNSDTSRDSINYLHSLFSFISFFPEMERLFLLSPKYRRNFIDNLIFSRKKNYNTLVNKYKKLITERNKVLNSQFNENMWLEKLEQDIANSGIEIYLERESQLEILNKQLALLAKRKKHSYNIKVEILDIFIKEDMNLDYYSHSLKQSRLEDKLVGGAKIGPHKSDIFCKISDDISASQLSTGQQKTLVLLLILAQCNYLVEECKLSPILLMDEVCSHLDEKNRWILLQLTKDFNLQIFMTGTDKNLFSFLSTNTKFYNIRN